MVRPRYLLLKELLLANAIEFKTKNEPTLGSVRILSRSMHDRSRRTSNEYPFQIVLYRVSIADEIGSFIHYRVTRYPVRNI